MRRIYQRQMKPRRVDGKKVVTPWENIRLKDLPDRGPAGSLRKLVRQLPAGEKLYMLHGRYRVIEQ